MGGLISILADLVSAFDHKNWQHILFVAFLGALIVALIAYGLQGDSQ